MMNLACGVIAGFYLSDLAENTARFLTPGSRCLSAVC